jgi:hypothetical protein
MTASGITGGCASRKDIGGACDRVVARFSRRATLAFTGLTRTNKTIPAGTFAIVIGFNGATTWAAAIIRQTSVIR